MTGALAQTNAALRKFSDSNTEWYWRFAVLKAEILVRQGFAQDSLDLLKADLPPSLAATDVAAWRKLAQAAANSFLLRLDEAERDLQQAEALARSGHPELKGEVALRKGTLAFYRNDFVSAQAAYRSALLIAQEKEDEFLEAAAMGSLGLIAMREEHYDEAIDFDLAALALARRLGAKTSVARILGNLGWNYFMLGDFPRALSSLNEAEGLSSQLDAKRDQVIWLTNIGTIYLNQGDLLLAEDYYRRALLLGRQLGSKARVTECLVNLAFVALRRGDIASAEALNEEAVSLQEETRDRSEEPYSSTIAGRIAIGRRDFAKAEALFRKVQRENAKHTSVVLYAQQNLANLYVSEGKYAAAEGEFRSALRMVERARSAVKREESRLSFLTSETELYADYANFLVSRGRLAKALEVTELSRARTLAEGLGFGSAKLQFPLKGFRLQETARRLQATILSYWLGVKRSYLWAFGPTGQSCFYTLPPASEIEPLVQAYREALVGPRDVLETANPNGTKLYDILIAPAKHLIPKGARVVIIPDGALYKLNFEALLAPQPQLHYWIEDVTVTNASSLLLLDAASRKPRASTGKLLLIGDPVSPSNEFPALGQAASEIRQIEKYFPPDERKTVSGARATAAAYFEAEPGQYSFVHFVAHGTASRTSPLDSAVILSRQGDSYKLYARDIVAKPLRANLVTISACNGAGTRTYSGEGLVGLSWAFLRAGAHNVIAALWEVSDASTPQLMDGLYGELSRGRDPAAALRTAKLGLLHSDSVYKKPFYWAPFQLYAGS